MTATITAFTEAHAAPAGEVVGYVTVVHAPEHGLGAVQLIVRDRRDQCVSLIVPPSDWRRMLADAAGQFARMERMN